MLRQGLECTPLVCSVDDELEVSGPTYHVATDVYQLVIRHSKTFGEHATLFLGSNTD